MKTLLKLLMALAAVAPTTLAPVSSHAVTALPAWIDGPTSGEPAQLADSVMGDWCFLRTENWEGKSVRLYGRKNRCQEWMTVGPTTYRARNRNCEVMKMGFGEYYKNVAVEYRCSWSEGEKVWTETVEMGLTGTRTVDDLPNLYVQDMENRRDRPSQARQTLLERISDGRWCASEKSYSLNYGGDNIIWTDNLGNVDVEDIVSNVEDEAHTRTRRSGHWDNKKVPTGTMWSYWMIGHDRVQVRSSTGSQFPLTRC
jgi:hypothetical protein